MVSHSLFAFPWTLPEALVEAAGGWPCARRGPGPTATSSRSHSLLSVVAGGAGKVRGYDQQPTMRTMKKKKR